MEYLGILKNRWKYQWEFFRIPRNSQSLKVLRKLSLEFMGIIGNCKNTLAMWLILFSQGKVYLNLSLLKIEIFDCQLRWKGLTPNICFLLPHFTHARYSLQRSGNHGGHQEQAKAEWILLFCLQILFVLACFWSTEPCKILCYQSKLR